ncbi:Cupin domain-containing protein [Variovorax sp. OK212]|nr:Cupin domain-containing protein [Variovorax sp. OK202]SFD44789.1 Cupin domain-containing protein [Variovorax sp. OK212]
MKSATFCLPMAAVAGVGFALLMHAPIGNAQQTQGPSEGKGSSTAALASIDLAAEFEGGLGRQLRARLVTIEPGGHTAFHSHTDRPTLEYVVQGDVVEIRNGVEIAHHQGEMVRAAHDVSHWWENRGTVPVLLLPVDVFRP